MTSLLSHKFGPAKYGRGGLAKNMEPRKLAENKNANERNTLPVVYNINSSTVTLSQHQNYNIYICT